MVSNLAAPGRLSAASSPNRILAAICTAHWVSHFHILVLPPLFPFLKDRLAVGYLDLGFALTVFSVVSGLTQAPIGAVVDRFGPKRILIAGLWIGGLAFALLGLWPTYPMLLVSSAIAGLANSVYHPANYSILAAHMGEARMGRAFSIHTFAGFFGGAVAPAALLVLVAYFGLSTALIVAGALGPLAAVCVAATSLGSAHATGSASAGASGSASLATVMTPALMALTGFFTLLSLSNMGITSFSVVALMSGYGITFEAANIALTAFLACSAIGVLAGGVLADRTRRHGEVAAACFAANSILVLLIGLLSPGPVLLTTIMAVAGFLGGVIAPSRDMLVRKAAPPGAQGRAFGIVSTGFNIGGIIAPLIYGAIMDHHAPAWVFGVSAAFMLGGVVLTLATEKWPSRAVVAS
jgi:MFS family permease